MASDKKAVPVRKDCVCDVCIYETKKLGIIYYPEGIIFRDPKKPVQVFKIEVCSSKEYDMEKLMMMTTYFYFQKFIKCNICRVSIERSQPFASWKGFLYCQNNWNNVVKTLEIEFALKEQIIINITQTKLRSEHMNESGSSSNTSTSSEAMQEMNKIEVIVNNNELLDCTKDHDYIETNIRNTVNETEKKSSQTSEIMNEFNESNEDINTKKITMNRVPFYYQFSQKYNKHLIKQTCDSTVPDEVFLDTTNIEDINPLLAVNSTPTSSNIFKKHEVVKNNDISDIIISNNDKIPDFSDVNLLSNDDCDITNNLRHSEVIDTNSIIDELIENSTHQKFSSPTESDDSEINSLEAVNSTPISFHRTTNEGMFENSNSFIPEYMIVDLPSDDDFDFPDVNFRSEVNNEDLKIKKVSEEFVKTSKTNDDVQSPCTLTKSDSSLVITSIFNYNEMILMNPDDTTASFTNDSNHDSKNLLNNLKEILDDLEVKIEDDDSTDTCSMDTLILSPRIDQENNNYDNETELYENNSPEPSFINNENKTKYLQNATETKPSHNNVIEPIQDGNNSGVESESNDIKLLRLYCLKRNRTAFVEAEKKIKTICAKIKNTSNNENIEKIKKYKKKGRPTLKKLIQNSENSENSEENTSGIDIDRNVMYENKIIIKNNQILSPLKANNQTDIYSTEFQGDDSESSENESANQSFLDKSIESDKRSIYRSDINSNDAGPEWSEESSDGLLYGNEEKLLDEKILNDHRKTQLYQKLKPPRKKSRHTITRLQMQERSNENLDKTSFGEKSIEEMICPSSNKENKKMSSKLRKHKKKRRHSIATLPMQECSDDDLNKSFASEKQSIKEISQSSDKENLKSNSELKKRKKKYYTKEISKINNKSSEMTDKNIKYENKILIKNNQIVRPLMEHNMNSKVTIEKENNEPKSTDSYQILYTKSAENQNDFSKYSSNSVSKLPGWSGGKFEVFTDNNIEKNLKSSDEFKMKVHRTYENKNKKLSLITKNENDNTHYKNSTNVDEFNRILTHKFIHEKW